MSERDKSISVSEGRICFSGSRRRKSSASWSNKTVKGKHSEVHQNPSQNNDPPHLKEIRSQRRYGERSRVRLRPVLQDEPTNGKYGGEKSCTSDYKRRALAKGKLEFISYFLSSPFQIFLCTSFEFPTACLKVSNSFPACWNFYSNFPFLQKYQK